MKVLIESLNPNTPYEIFVVYKIINRKHEYWFSTNKESELAKNILFLKKMFPNMELQYKKDVCCEISDFEKNENVLKEFFG